MIGKPQFSIIDNDTPMDRVGLNHSEEVLFDKYVANIEKMLR